MVSKPIAKKYNLLLRICPRDLQAIDRRIDDANIRAARFEHEKIAVGPGYAQHVAEGTEDYAGSRCDCVRFIDHLERSGADRTTRPVHQLEFIRQQTIDTLFGDAASLAAADFHQHP